MTQLGQDYRQPTNYYYSARRLIGSRVIWSDIADPFKRRALYQLCVDYFTHFEKQSVKVLPLKK